MGQHSFDWRAWSLIPENKTLIAENMIKAVSKFKREQWLWEAKHEYLAMAYNPSHVANGQANAGTTIQDEVEVDISNFPTPRAVATMAIGFASAAATRYFGIDGTLVYDETGNNDYRPIFKIYS